MGVSHEWYEKQPKETARLCDLCGHNGFFVIAERDRYGLPARFQQCQNCLLVTCNPRLTQKGYREFYAEHYRPLISEYSGIESNAETIQTSQQQYAAAIVDRLAEFDIRGSLLDVGGSTGVIAAALEKHFKVAATVIDPSPDEIAVARKSGLTAKVATIDDVGWNVSYENVCMFQTVEHLMSIKQAFRKIHAITKRYFIFDVVDWMKLADAMLKTHGTWEHACKVDHCFNLTFPQARDYAKRAGFTVQSELPFGRHRLFVCRKDSP